MDFAESPIRELRNRILRDELDPRAIAEDALAHANSNASRNVYLSLDRDWTLAEAAALPERFPATGPQPLLYGLPISLKDCFDLAGFPTTCGSRFYAGHNGLATTDSWVAEKLRGQGAILTGKTHLQQLAYGITGENADYGDCVQPRDAALLTGGSSSGAAASVQEGSAIAAIGTDTGGSVRVPAALCGLAGFRASVGVSRGEERWSGAFHLAPSFDTLGLLFRDLRDGPSLANAIYDIPAAPTPTQLRIGYAGDDFTYDSET